ncbi:Kelch repeat-containing protein, partial [Elusimicrobiota bacterium]
MRFFAWRGFPGSLSALSTFLKKLTKLTTSPVVLILGVLVVGFAGRVFAGDPTATNTSMVGTSSATWYWDGIEGGETAHVVLSTVSDFSSVLNEDDGELGQLTTTYINLIANTTYYFKVKRTGEDDATYVPDQTPGHSTATYMQVPTNIYLDISSISIVATVYVSTPGNMNDLCDAPGVDIAIGGAYEGWTEGGDRWTAMPDALGGRRYAGSVALGGKMYVIIGAVNDEFDPVVNAWIARTARPTSRTYPNVVALGGKIYAIGGEGGGNTDYAENEVYDPASDTWTTLSSMPTARSKAAIAAVGGKIYVIGGNNGIAAEATNKNEEYDPATNSWTTMNSTGLTARYSPGTGVINGKIYVINGVGGHGKFNEEFDPATNNDWVARKMTAFGRGGTAAAVLGGKIYLIGGANGRDYNETYDPVTNHWLTMTRMPTPRNVMTVTALGGKIYVVGGEDGGTYVTHEEYDPGLSIKFSSLDPNTQYDFKAK